MENSNRPVQRVTPIRSEYPSRLESNLNIQSSSSLSEFSHCIQNNLSNINVEEFKVNTNSNNDTTSSQSANIINSLPFLQQNVNIMNINLPNNTTILQNVPQDSVSIQNPNFKQPLSNQKTLIQLPDGRLVQFAQNLQQTTQPIQTAILVQMPYKVVDQNVQKINQNSINKKFLLPSKSVEKSPQNIKSISLANGNTININSDLILAPSIDQASQQLMNDYQKTIKDQLNSSNFDQKLITTQTTTLNLEKYQEICALLHNNKLLTKFNTNEETVLVEFRLNQQKYQLRMTRNQKVEMEKILISVGNQQRQMEILQVYQAEQRKMMQQRPSLVLNQILNQPAPNIVCNKPPIQGLNIAKQVYPINSVLLTVPQNQFCDANLVQSSNVINQSKNIAIQPTASPGTNGIILATRLPITQQTNNTSNILSSSSIIRDCNKKTLIRQKRNVKTPNTITLATAAPTSAATTQQPVNALFRGEFLPNANANNEMKPARSRRYNNMRKVLLDSHKAVLMPDYLTPFTDMTDAVQRLLPYHIFEESKDVKTTEVDKILDNAFSELNKKCANLKRITSALSMNILLKDKIPESLIIKRMRLDLEKDIFDHEKLMYINGDQLPFNSLQFDKDGNTCPISIDSPSCSPLPPALELLPSTDFQDNEIQNSQTVFPDLASSAVGYHQSCDDGSSFVECPIASGRGGLEEGEAGGGVRGCAEDTTIVDSSENLPDSLCHYDIQDISVDSIDSPISECDWNNVHDKDSLNSEITGNPQSEDPDLDAAIKSILF